MLFHRLRTVCIAALFVAASIIPPANAAIVFNEDFTASSIDSAWNVSFSIATGWNYTVPSASGTDLVVTDISAAPNSIENNGPQAAVNLIRAVQPLADFQLRFNFAWDSAGTNSAMQWLYLSLLDDNEQVVAYTGYQDAWIFSRGSKVAFVGNTGTGSLADTLPLSGSAAVEIERVGAVTTIHWDGQQLVSAASSGAISAVRLSFQSYNYVGRLGTSSFGSESVDLISLSAPDQASVPEPASLALWSLGALGMTLLHRRRRTSANSHHF